MTAKRQATTCLHPIDTAPFTLTMTSTAVRTAARLAYVLTQCCDGPKALFSERQALHILHGDRDVTVMETPGVVHFFSGVAAGLCRQENLCRFGDLSERREVNPVALGVESTTACPTRHRFTGARYSPRGRQALRFACRRLRSRSRACR